jgi:fatty-acyl-CoA synthase
MHRNLVHAARAADRALERSEADRVLTTLPFFTVFGMGAAMATVIAGGTPVTPPRLEAPAALEWIGGERLTVVHGVPTRFRLWMRQPTLGSRNTSTVRTGIVAGAPVSVDQVRRIRRWNDVQIAYGLTETGPTVTITRFDDPAERREKRVGRPIGGGEVRAVDLAGEPSPPGVAGELAVRGPDVMWGYHRMPSATQRSFRSGGDLLTGDLALLDDEGYVTITGRRKEMIIRGGFSVLPRELEHVLRTHSAVDGARVIGLPHEVPGERIRASVVSVEGALVSEDDLTDYRREQLADFKVPDRVRFFDAFPLTGSGKVKRQELAQVVATELTST